jgi:hypothetical protein
MHTVTMSDEEHTLLIELLDSQLKDLPHEIHHTDDHDYRQMLHEKEKLIEAFLKRVKEA